MAGQNRSQICQKVNKKRGWIPMLFFLLIFDRLLRVWSLEKYAKRRGGPSKIKKLACSETYPKKLTKIGQNASKIELESIKSAIRKRIKNCNRFLIDFVSIWPPKSPPKSVLNSTFWGPFRLRASTWRPQALKK